MNHVAVAPNKQLTLVCKWVLGTSQDSRSDWGGKINKVVNIAK